ncbi:MAG: hypothetical protein ACRD2R_01055, partial [Terriglobales bacterium]
MPKKPAARKSQARPKPVGAKWIGKSVPRKEEARLLRGQGKFVDDYKIQGMLYLRMVRSPFGHARVKSVDVSQAEAHPGVVCTLTGAEVTGMVQPFIEIGPPPGGKILDYPMAADHARYQGEPVAAVIAETQLAAEDAAELVSVDYEALDPVIDAEAALQDKSILHPSSGTNVVWQG